MDKMENKIMKKVITKRIWLCLALWGLVAYATYGLIVYSRYLLLDGYILNFKRIFSYNPQMLVAAVVIRIFFVMQLLLAAVIRTKLIFSKQAYEIEIDKKYNKYFSIVMLICGIICLLMTGSYSTHLLWFAIFIAITFTIKCVIMAIKTHVRVEKIVNCDNQEALLYGLLIPLLTSSPSPVCWSSSTALPSRR